MVVFEGFMFRIKDQTPGIKPRVLPRSAAACEVLELLLSLLGFFENVHLKNMETSQANHGENDEK